MTRAPVAEVSLWLNHCLLVAAALPLHTPPGPQSCPPAVGAGLPRRPARPPFTSPLSSWMLMPLCPPSRPFTWISSTADGVGKRKSTQKWKLGRSMDHAMHSMPSAVGGGPVEGGGSSTDPKAAPLHALLASRATSATSQAPPLTSVLGRQALLLQLKPQHAVAAAWGAAARAGQRAGLSALSSSACMHKTWIPRCRCPVQALKPCRGAHPRSR